MSSPATPFPQADRVAGQRAERQATTRAPDGSVEPGGTDLQPCELRRRRTLGESVELLCGAGGFTLGLVGRDDEAIAATCNTCPIPAELTDRWACLHLRPIRIERDGSLRSFLSCRWFYTLNLQRQPQSLREMCHGCQYWFPRPEVTLIPRYWQETDRIRAAVANPDPAPKPTPSWREDERARPSTPWQWIRHHLLGWI